ncbi:MAG: hypothetical protein Q8P68_01380 [Candidatus Peregrinibacteria bacterium]|nr:hypothetical protein [Candidatus Peregrinibacteria bacterium]
MNEHEFPKPNPSPEQEPKGHPRTSVTELNPAHAEQAPEWLAKYADEPEVAQLSPEECEQKINELEGLLTAFEATHPIAELYAITDLAVKDAPNHLAREAAKQGLIPIVVALNFLKEKTNISPEEYEKLKARYKYLTRAVGMIEAKTGKIDHER